MVDGSLILNFNLVGWAKQMDLFAIKNISKDNFVHIPQEFFFTVLHEGFKSKRKQLFVNLSALIAREKLIHIFSTLSISEKVRGEDLPLSKWLELTKILYTHMHPHSDPQS